MKIVNTFFIILFVGSSAACFSAEKLKKAPPPVSPKPPALQEQARLIQTVVDDMCQQAFGQHEQTKHVVSKGLNVLVGCHIDLRKQVARQQEEIKRLQAQIRSQEQFQEGVLKVMSQVFGQHFKIEVGSVPQGDPLQALVKLAIQNHGEIRALSRAMQVTPTPQEPSAEAAALVDQDGTKK